MAMVSPSPWNCGSVSRPYRLALSAGGARPALRGGRGGPSGVPLRLGSVATFTVASGRHGAGGGVGSASLTEALLGLVYSLVNIAYGSLAAAMTQVPTERAKLASWRVYGSNLTILMLAFVVAPQIKGSGNLQHSLTITTLVFVVVGAALYVFTFLTAREQVQRDVPVVSIRQSFATLRSNRPLIMLCVSSLLFLTGMIAASTVGAYYARDVLGNAEMFIYMTLAQTVGTFAIALSSRVSSGPSERRRATWRWAWSPSSRASASPWPRPRSR